MLRPNRPRLHSLRRPAFSRRLPAVTALLMLASAGVSGCGTVRTLVIGSSSGARLDRTEQRARKPTDRRVREMTVAVTADPAGQIVDVRFVRSSGSEAVDNFVRESIRSTFPGSARPNTVTTMELTYSSMDGFSEPKVLNVQPL